MNIEQLREFCLSRKGASESFPFTDDVLVFKVMNKMFAVVWLVPSDEGFSVIVKCDAQKAIELRDKYDSVRPGYHFNKKYWNSIYLNGDMPDSEIRHWINHSIDEVVKKLSQKQQKEYAAL